MNKRPYPTVKATMRSFLFVWSVVLFLCMWLLLVDAVAEAADRRWPQPLFVEMEHCTIPGQVC